MIFHNAWYFLTWVFSNMLKYRLKQQVPLNKMDMKFDCFYIFEVSVDFQMKALPSYLDSFHK